MSDNPQLLFVAGPNGAGKSTYSKVLSKPDAIIFDVDRVIAHIVAQSPGMSKKQVYQAATQEFFNQAKRAIRKRQHFTLETNFRDQELMDVVAEFKQFGYTTSLVYLTLENIQQSIDRVNERVVSGGHYVDFKNITENYELGLQYLEHFSHQFDNLEIVNASSSGYELRSLLSVQNQTLQHLSNILPEGVASTINAIAQRFIPPPDLEEEQYRGPRR